MAAGEKSMGTYDLATLMAEADSFWGLVNSGVNAGRISVSAVRTRLNTGVQAFTTDVGIGGDLTMTGDVVIPDGGTIGQAAGPLMTFDDTNNYLEITGCNVGIGTSAATNLLTLGDTTSVISTDTSGGSDNKRLQLAGGGSGSSARGAYVNLFGNENTSGYGNIDISAGNSGVSSNGYVRILTGASAERLIVDKDGDITMSSLAGTGTRNVVVDANGKLSAP